MTEQSVVTTQKAKQESRHLQYHYAASKQSQEGIRVSSPCEHKTMPLGRYSPGQVYSRYAALQGTNKHLSKVAP